MVSKSIREQDASILAHRAAQVQKGGARAAVLGVNDGLVSVLCLVLGVAGAGADQNAVLIAGFASVVAGAFSMAAGEWISVKAQVDLFEGVLSDLRGMIRRDKELLQETLTEHYIGDGYSQKSAKAVVADISTDTKAFYQAYAEQVVGVNPNELGSPWVAAISSFALFVAGSLAPLSPWFFTHGTLAIALSIALTGLGGLITGAYVAYSSGKSLAYGALRQFLIVVFASAVTYGIGRAFGMVL
ncbi:MAG: VIT1/CCC1 transporter family protein [Acidobacteriota bacterium]